jgi:hypothetical protein
VGKGGEGEATVGEAYSFGIIAEHLVGCFNDLALVLCQRLPASFFNAMPYDQLMNFRYKQQLPDRIEFRKLGACLRKLFGRYLVS